MDPTGGYANSYQPKTTLLPVLIRTKKWSQQGGMQILINQQVHSCTLYSIWDTKMNPTRGHANLYQTKQIWQGSNHQNIQDDTNRVKNHNKFVFETIQGCKKRWGNGSEAEFGYKLIERHFSTANQKVQFFNFVDQSRGTATSQLRRRRRKSIKTLRHKKKPLAINRSRANRGVEFFYNRDQSLARK